jgi:uracil-DNA glycosylase
MNQKNLILEKMDILEKAKQIRDDLKNSSDFELNTINNVLYPIEPFIGEGKIKLIIIGQDPTIRNEKSRANIKYTLNLDKSNSLQTYVIKSICEPLGIKLENVYATNVFKYFYTYPPADTPEVLQKHLEPNLNLLLDELEQYPNVPVITLGEPVLKLLCNPKAKVREYWDYNSKTGKSDLNFKLCQTADNKINRDFYPFPHQPSLRKVFYKNTIGEYVRFVKKLQDSF